MASTEIICAVDGGGSGCRAAAFDLAGRVLAEAKAGPANAFTDFDGAAESARRALFAVADKVRVPIEELRHCHIHIGLAGVMGSEMAESVKNCLPFVNLTVSDDRETTVRGALGNNDGGVISVGTGTFLGIRHDGSTRFFGGWGHILADQASGCWLGKQALQHAILAHDGVVEMSELAKFLLDEFGGEALGLVRFANTATPKYFAALAPDIVRLAQDNEPVAKHLLVKGANYLSSCLEAAGLPKPSVLCFTGGLGAHYQPFFDGNPAYRIKAPDGDALLGGYRIVRERLLAQAEAS